MSSNKSDLEKDTLSLGYDSSNNSHSLHNLKDKIILKLLLKIRSGDEHQRKICVKHLVYHVEEFGVARVFEKILPLLMSQTIATYERHLLFSIIQRISKILGFRIKAFLNQILMILMPMLI